MILEHDLDTINICLAVKKMPMEQAGTKNRAGQACYIKQDAYGILNHIINI